MYPIALFRLGFRPFFLFAAVYSVLAMALWFELYRRGLPSLAAGRLPAMVWHAHTMIYGYAQAVVVGFLLTAVGNWTGRQTLHGTGLIVLSGLWWLARSMPFLPWAGALPAMAWFDLLFTVIAALAVLHPIVQARAWKQIGVWTKLLMLGVGNGLFYLGVFGVLADGVRLGLYTGLFMLVSLLLLMARRVIPFFIEKGVGYPVSLHNSRWLDLASLVLMLVFIVVAVWWPRPDVAAWTAVALCGVHALRLKGWHTTGIWRVPLLWSLYLGYGWLVLGFALYALARWPGLNPMLAIHAFAFGGIGVISLSMMARVTLGHTGRDVQHPPRSVAWMLGLLMLGTVVRVLSPIATPAWYGAWIALSQVLWIIAFGLFVGVYAPMLVSPRRDAGTG